ncbi:hypothetical protein ACFL22_01155 [Patescibacteria group bacterium]
MEAKKIALACFIGGALCCAVALWFSPTYWWLGLIAGFAAGYISYEFREVCQAVPTALRAAKRDGADVWEKRLVDVKNWLSKRHPFLYPAAIVATPFYIWGVYKLSPYLTSDLSERSGGLFAILSIVFLLGLIIAFIEVVLVVIAPFAITAFIGARIGEKCYWYPFLMSGSTTEKDLKELDDKGLKRKPATYSNVLRWTIKGFGITILFFVWTLWKKIFLCVWNVLCFLSRFAKQFFILIHSDKRLLCAIDSAIGGAVSYAVFFSSSMSLSEHFILVSFGGLIGAALGVLNWEIVSKRILHVPSSMS